VRLTTSPPLCAECHEIWEPKPPGTLWATPGLLRDPFTFFLHCMLGGQVSSVGTGWTVRRLNPGGGEIFHAVQTVPEAHPPPCTMGTGSLREVRRSELVIDYLLAPGVLIVLSYISPAVCVCPYTSRSDLYLYTV
jgi:hypothetical protein